MKPIGIKPRACIRALRYFGALLAASLLAGCSPFPVLNGLGTDSTYRKLSTLRYGNEPRLQLDVYQPVVAHNGATVVIPDYRIYPGAVFPAFMHDAAAAVAWTHRHIAEYGDDPKKIYLMGHSAGGHIATLLALDARYRTALGLSTEVLAGVVGLAAPTNFAATLEAKYRPAFVNQTELERAQPIRCVRADAPPLLLQHGADDTVVQPRNSLALADRITALGEQARARIYPGKGHSGLILIFSRLFGRSPILDDTLNFLGLNAGA